MSFLQEYRNRPRRVVFYGRVSTEHEAQVSALDNQMDWYQELAAKNPNWEVVGQYVDEGITGTQATKRPSFMQMIEDAQSGKFDLIVTREVCRFARNTVDTLSYTRKLSKLGVEVYFASDNIWTMDNDGELWLTIMATMAQEESRKISERVRAGIQMSREKGVLYGNGNILGYDLDKIHKTYIINEEQAETVRMIFEQYATGDGLGKVAKALIAKGRKDGGGRLKWDSSKITRILRNPTYMGYCVYNRTQTTDLLEHSRKKNNDEETYILKKGNFTPIIDEELWHRCNDIRRSRQRNLLDENGKPRKYGGTVAKNVWVTKLVCHCGSKLRRYLWNTKRDGTQVYGFECYRHKKQSALYLKKHGLPEGICELKAFPEWKLELMALKIFETVWGNRREAVLEACRMLSACYREESADPAKLKALDKRMDALNQRLDNLIMMKASNQITLGQFVEQSNEIGVQQQRVNKEKAELLAKQGDHKALDMDAIEASLCEAVDFTKGMVSEWFIQNFVRRITPIDDTRFAWVLDLAPEPQTLVCEVNGRKEYPRITLESNLYRGAWPPSGASRQTFLINRNGRLNGDISAAGLAQDSRWYLEGYPVKIWSRTDGSLLVIGFQPGTWVKYYYALELPYITVLLGGSIAFFLINLILVVFLILRNTRKVEKAMPPILQGIQDLTHGKAQHLDENGELAEINAGLNRAAAYMHQKDNTRAEWIRGVSHDIRTPLSMVLGYASELEDDTALPQEARKQAGIIRRESEKMKRLIDDLNLTTKLEYALQPVHRKEVDWVELNRQTVSEVLNNGLDSRYEITFTEMQPGHTIHLMGDAGLLQRMLENLIQNCITHNPQGCTITLSVGEENGCALCVISDDGVGIAPDRLEALNGGDAIDSSQGSDEKAEHGLGLKLVAQIVKAHQGTISFAGSIPHGLTVKISLPMHPNIS